MLDGGVKSDRDNISYQINYKNHSETGSLTNSTNDEEPISTVPVASPGKNFFNKASGDSGLSGGAIAGIVIACAVALIAVLVIAYIIKSGRKPTVNQTVTAPIENSSEIGNSVGQFKATV